MIKSAPGRKTVLKALGIGAFFFLFSLSAAAQTLPVITEGKGVHFEAGDGSAPPITLDSTEVIDVRLVSALKTTTLRLESSSASSTILTIGGLSPERLYFIYTGDYHHKTIFTTDPEGRLAFTQDIANPQFLIIQPRESTYFIRDNTTGGDCVSIGIWNSATKTCVLTGNLAQTIQIDADGVTLDGGGYMLSGPGSGMGVFLAGRKGVTIRNLTIKNFRDNIALVSSEGITVEGNTLIEGAFGVSADTASSTSITKNTFTTLSFGISLLYSNANILSQNVITNFHSSGGISLSRSNKNTIIRNRIENGPTGITLQLSLNNTIQNNIIRNSGYYAMSLQYSQNNAIFQNNFFTSAIRHINSFNSVSLFNRALPDGGNYWDTYDKPAEGCTDTNADSICDTPLVLDRFNSDFFPWTIQEGWGGTPDTSATLSYTEEEGYADDAESSGVHPNKGTASSTPMVFKAVYTGATAPSGMNVLVGNGTATTSHPMAFDATTASTTLRDGIFTNGEQYIATQTFPKGKYQYYFEAQSASTTVYLPADGALSFQTGYSNVAFLPGLEASRLYTREGIFENELWIPNVNNDVRKLALSSTTGESVNLNIYTNDVVDEAYTVNIYKGFLAHMNNMVANGDIEEFKPLPYDWRMDVKDVAISVVPLESGGYTMVSRIEEMASISPTGKVTLITHSNGGLVAKELINELERQGKAHLVDRVIMVAAPELGTPKAILEMLHGAKFPIGFPSKEVTRELAENMKSAYTLLPSREYFNRVDSRPVIEFSTTTPITQNFRDIYDSSISDYDTLRRFLRGENGTRTEPEASAVNEPNVLKENFLANAETRHEELDAWTPPLGIDVIEVIGWGLDTPRGVKYEAVKKRVCNADLSVCSKIDVIDPQPLATSEGDGTVVYSSAEALGGERYWVEINEYNKDTLINREHKNILEIEPLQVLFTTLIKNEATSTLPSFISSAKPPETNADKRLRVGVHSPVALHLYDTLGRHTGPIPNPDLSSDLEFFEEQIPNSYYWQVGEGQYAGADGALTTTIELKGTGFGTFTIDIENTVGGVTATTATYKDIPVTASTTATIQAGENIALLLKMDINGDGIIDAEITPGGLTVQELAGILKGLVKTLHLSAEKEKKLIKKIEKLEKELAKESKNERKEKQKTEHAFEEIIKTIKKYEKKRILSHDEAGELIVIIEQIQEMVVE